MCSQAQGGQRQGFLAITLPASCISGDPGLGGGHITLLCEQMGGPPDTPPDTPSPPLKDLGWCPPGTLWVFQGQCGSTSWSCLP